MVKRILNVIIMFLIILCMFFIVYDVKADNFNEIAISVIDPTEDYGLYMLLPETYINHVNSRTGTSHAIDNIYGNSQANIDFISYFDVGNVQSELYEDTDGTRYLQYKLSPVSNYTTFKVAPSYYNMDLKIRVRSTNKDQVIDLSEFKFNTDGKCSVKYNYKDDTIITDEVVKSTGTRYLVLLAILFVVMAIVSYTDRVGQVKQRRKNF